MARNRLSGIALAIFILLGNFQSSGCAKSSSVSNDVALAWESDPTPPRLGVNTFTVTLQGGQGERLAGARISLEGNMTHPGISPIFGEAQETAPGRYQGTLDFNMPGDWTVSLHIQLASGRTYDRQVQIRNLQAN